MERVCADGARNAGLFAPLVENGLPGSLCYASEGRRAAPNREMGPSIGGATTAIRSSIERLGASLRESLDRRGG